MNQKTDGGRLIVLFLASYFTRFPMIGGVIGERYVGLYHTFSEKFSPVYDFYYYATSNARLYQFRDQQYELTKGRFLSAILLRLVRASSKRRQKLVIIGAYPMACTKLSFLITLPFLLMLKIFNWAKIILDVIDLPAYPGRESGHWKILPARIHEAVCLEIAFCITVPTSWCREYFLSRNRHSRIEVLPMAGFSQFIKPIDKTGSDKFKVLYVGPVAKERGVDKLFRCIEKIHQKDPRVQLILVTGPRPKLRLPERKWLKVHFHIPNYLHLIKIVSEATVGMIPYPSSSYWDGAFMSKMCLYMATGAPTISTNLFETAKVLMKLQCGLVGKNWLEIEEIIGKLMKDPELTLRLGQNARRAVEKEYNWFFRAGQLRTLIKNLTGNE